MLVVHRAERATTLADALADVLAEPLDDPFAPELVAVPAKGVERWLAQRLSHRLGRRDGDDGICANVRFPSPRRLLDDVVATAAPQQAAALRAWAPDQLRWTVLAVLDEVVDEPWCAVVRRHLHGDLARRTDAHQPAAGRPGLSTASTLSTGTPADPGPSDRRLTLATHVARLLDSYARSRPHLLTRWEAGDLVLPDGSPLAAPEEWQARVWLRVRDRLGRSPVSLHEQVLDAVRARPDLPGVPPRLGVFGASRLPRSDVELLAALAEHRDVHLWLHHASPALWDAVAAAPTAQRRSEEATVVRHPLLRSLSRDVRELQHLLRAHAPGHTTIHHSGSDDAAGAGGPTLLARLRDDLAHDRPLHATTPDAPGSTPRLDPADRSVQVHACHGRTRQVEVLRDVVVGLLADDPTLEPRDVLVMCPDVETFAPLLGAVFAAPVEDLAPAGTGGGAQSAAPTAVDPARAVHPAARLRVRVADRALHQANPLLAVLDRLLGLGTSRLSAPEVLDLAGHPAVSRRMGLDEDGLERLREWVQTAGVRWGLHRDHRGAWQMQHVPDGTWRLGLDRLLLGAAVEPAQGAAATTVAGLVPVDDVDSADIDLAGRVAELVDRLDDAHERLSGTWTAPEWADVLEDVTLRLAAPERDGAWQVVQLREVLEETLLGVDPDDPLADLRDDAPAAGLTDAAGTTSPGTTAPGTTAPGEGRLTLAELAPVLRDALAGRPSRTGFRTGALTVCTLVPMRSVPHRVVVLLGLDDGTFPRRTVRDGDDLLARDPWVGDRDPRSEDRQLLLDAISAAGEHLVVLYTGHDERTGAPVPPAVPLGELLDTLDRTVAPPEGVALTRDAVTVHHPLQPFDPRVFTPGALVPGPRPFGFDPRAYCGARAAVGPRQAPEPLLAAALPALPPGDVALEDLLATVVHPAKAFLRQRLQLGLTERDDDPADALPLELDGLERWAIGDRMLRARLAGLDGRDVQVLERGRGALPPGPLGEQVLLEVGALVDTVAEAARPLLVAEPDSVDVEVDLGDGTRLSGTVPGVRREVLVRVEYSTLAAKHRLQAWVRLLALTASSATAATSSTASTTSTTSNATAPPGAPWQAVTLGRSKGRCARSTLGPVEPEAALWLLRQLVALHRENLRAPLPVPCATAEAYATRRWQGRRQESARAAARREWTGGSFPGEAADPAHVLLHDGEVSFEQLLAAPAGPADRWQGWPEEETDRFGALALRLWHPLLRHEQLEVL